MKVNQPPPDRTRQGRQGTRQARHQGAPWVAPTPGPIPPGTPSPHRGPKAPGMAEHRCVCTSRGTPNTPRRPAHWATPTVHSCRNNTVGDGTVDGTTWCFPPSAPARWRIRIPGLRYEENPRPQPQGAPRVHHLPGPLGSWWWPVGEPDHPSSSSFLVSSFFSLGLLSSLFFLAEDTRTLRTG